MEWVVVGVVVVIALLAGAIMRRRALEAEAHTAKTAGPQDDSHDDRR
jgi:hypothetical protein